MTRLRAAIFDLDGTITRRDTYVAYLLGFLCRRPLRAVRTAPLPGAVALYCAGMRDNSWLKRAFLGAILGGAPRRDLERWTTTFVERALATGLRAGARPAIERHRAEGARLVLATASFDLYAESFAERLGFDDVVCTRTVWDAAGRLSGEIDGGNCYGQAKLARLVALLGPDASGFAAYTDHASDYPLLEWAEYPTAVNPTPRLRRLALANGIPIDDWNRPEPGHARAATQPLSPT